MTPQDRQLSSSNEPAKIQLAETTSVGRLGVEFDTARAAKDSLSKELEERNIRVTIGVTCLANSTFGIGIRVQAGDNISKDQLLELKALRSYQGIPVDTLVIDRPRRKQKE